MSDMTTAAVGAAPHEGTAAPTPDHRPGPAVVAVFGMHDAAAAAVRALGRADFDLRRGSVVRYTGA